MLGQRCRVVCFSGQAGRPTFPTLRVYRESEAAPGGVLASRLTTAPCRAQLLLWVFGRSVCLKAVWEQLAVDRADPGVSCEGYSRSR